MRRRLQWRWVAFVGSVALVSTATSIRGSFTLDESHYLTAVVALQHGQLGALGSVGMPPSRELAFFDPVGYARVIDRMPISPTVAPLYAPLALPFSFGGWYGLVFLNALAYGGTLLLIYQLGALGRDRATGWAAMWVFLLGIYGFEYVQGVWPHALAVFLTTLCFWAAHGPPAGLGRSGRPALWALAAGLAGGLAAGVRHQNVIFAGAVGLGLLLVPWLRTPLRRRLTTAASFGLGLAVPLGIGSWLQYQRLGWWNPLTKGQGYLSSVAADGALQHPVLDTLRTFWFRVVDMGSRPTFQGDRLPWMRPDPDTGMYLFDGATKKAWLQSGPWLVVALAVLAAAWIAPRHLDDRRRAVGRRAALVVAAVLAVFALAGSDRTDGRCFNQRYFLELLPLMAVALSWALSRGLERVSRRQLVLAALAGAGLVVGLQAVGGSLRLHGVRWIPLALAGGALVTWLVRNRPGGIRWAAASLALALGWASAIHLTEDYRSSRGLREWNQERLQVITEAASGPVALFAWGGAVEPLAPLLFDPTVWIADPSYDDGETMPRLVDLMRQQERRILLVWQPPEDPFAATELAGTRRSLAIPPPIMVEELVADH